MTKPWHDIVLVCIVYAFYTILRFTVYLKNDSLNKYLQQFLTILKDLNSFLKPPAWHKSKSQHYFYQKKCSTSIILFVDKPDFIMGRV